VLACGKSMPELPEVEMARRRFTRWMRGQRVVHTEAEPDGRTLLQSQRKAFLALDGKLTDSDRRGKFLRLSFGPQTQLLLHLGMSGKLVKAKRELPVKWSRVSFYLSGGAVIHFVDPRRFGRVEVLGPGQWEKHPSVVKLGRDILEDGLSLAQLKEVLGTSKQPLKVALMDQSKLAGFGNIHAVEALFRAALHPDRKPSTLTLPEWKKLHAALHASIQFGLDEQDTGDETTYVEEKKAPNPFLVYGRKGEKCSRCNAVIQSRTQAGRTTYFCGACQR
jgi:formamidopyrimidine-DNA glycosylase